MYFDNSKVFETVLLDVLLSKLKKCVDMKGPYSKSLLRNETIWVNVTFSDWHKRSKNMGLSLHLPLDHF